MGVIYKLTPKVREYILKQRLSDFSLGCRRLVSLVWDKFQIKVSKSTVNALIKQSGFNMPVGRRAKQSKITYSGLGVFFLMAMDLLTGGSQCITEVINKNIRHKVSSNKTEALLFNLFCPGPKILFGWKWTNQELSVYLTELQKIEKLKSEMSNLIDRGFQGVKCIKIEFKDGTHVFIDGQRHNVWPADKIPDIFSAPAYETNSYIKKYLNTAEPFVLLQASGYDKPAEVFLKCVSGLKGDNAVFKITLLDNNLKEQDCFAAPTDAGAPRNDKALLSKEKKHSLLFGVWPWQFADYRKIKTIGKFKPFIFEVLKDKLYIANAEFELLQPISNKSITLWGVVVQSAPDGPIRLFILTNDNEINFEQLTRIYFSHWPNLEEAFKDYSNKIELDSKSHGESFVVAEPARLNRIKDDKDDNGNNIEKIFQQYLNGLSLYFSRYFLPHTYQNNDFPSLKKDFYDLKGTVKKHKDYRVVTFNPPQDYPYLNELRYACNRMNERSIVLQRGKRLLFSLSPCGRG